MVFYKKKYILICSFNKISWKILLFPAEKNDLSGRFDSFLEQETIFWDVVLTTFFGYLPFSSENDKLCGRLHDF